MGQDEKTQPQTVAALTRHAKVCETNQLMQ